MEHVEDEQRGISAEVLEVSPAPASEPAHRDAERMRALVGAQGDRLRVEHGRPNGTSRIDSTISGTRAVTSARFRVYTHLVAQPVHLDAGTVELPLDRGGIDAIERGRQVRGELREHRLHRRHRREPEPGRGLRAASIAAAATVPRSPASIAARRTSPMGVDDARATASTITPSSAP